jgi:hypothetical protein
MWNIEKFDAVSGQGRQAAFRPSIFQSSQGLLWRRTSHSGLIGGPFLGGFCEEFRPFLTGSAPQTETHVTHSKQTTEKFLTGARTHFKLSPNWPKFSPKSVHGTRVAIHRSRVRLQGSRLSLATRHSPLATAVRYNAPCPNFSREVAA